MEASHFSKGCIIQTAFKSRVLNKREFLMIICLFLIEIICFDPSSEPSGQDGSDEGSQHMD